MEIVLILVILVALLAISVLGRLVMFYKKHLDEAYEMCDEWCEISKEHVTARKELSATIDRQHQTIKMQDELINHYREEV